METEGLDKFCAASREADQVGCAGGGPRIIGFTRKVSGKQTGWNWW